MQLALPYFELNLIDFFGYQIEFWKIMWFLGRVAFLLIFLFEARRLSLDKKTVWIIFLINL